MQMRMTSLAVCIVWAGLQNPSRAEEPSDKVKELQNEHLAAVSKICILALERYKQGDPGSSSDQVIQAQRAVLDARLELAETKEERIKAYEEMVKFAEQAQGLAERLELAGKGNMIDVLKAKAHLLRTRIGLEKAKTPK